MQQQASAKGDGSVRRKVPGNGETMLGLGVSGAKKRGTKNHFDFSLYQKNERPKKNREGSQRPATSTNDIGAQREFSTGVGKSTIFQCLLDTRGGNRSNRTGGEHLFVIFEATQEATQDGTTWVVAVGSRRE